MRGIIAGAVIVVIVAVIVIGARSNSVPAHPGNGANPGGTANPGGNGANSVLAPVTIVLECEDGKLETKSPDGREVLTVRTHNEGKPITFVDSPDAIVEDWLKTCGDQAGKLKATAGALPGKGSYEFEAPRARSGSTTVATLCG
jgi:hypothetical protein